MTEQKKHNLLGNVEGVIYLRKKGFCCPELHLILMVPTVRLPYKKVCQLQHSVDGSDSY